MLAGCATTRLVDSRVTTHSQLTSLPAGATYRFERLPSQQARADAQAALERAAAPALERAGLVARQDGARYSVLLGERQVREPRAPWDDPPTGPHALHGHLIAGTGGVAVQLTMPRLESPWYRREVSVLIRDLATQQVVYETHAAHDGRWADANVILPAMFEAALRDFPRASGGTRRVDVEIRP